MNFSLNSSPSSSSAFNSTVLIKIYYWLSPVFILVYAIWGSDIRISIPNTSPSVHYIYLAACFVLPGLLIKRPTIRALFALAESALNIFLLLYGVFLRYLEQIEALSQGSGTVSIMGSTDFMHFALAAIVLGLGFYGNPLVKPRK